MLRHLSLYSGYAGFELGLKLARLDFRTVAYCEIEPSCQEIIQARIRDGFLDDAPILGDVRAHLSAGTFRQFRGLVDIITGGFPCQPFSVAGKRREAADSRNLWPATADVIRDVQPRIGLLENVPGIRRYLPVVLRDLRRLGYTVRPPYQIGACDVGAPHRRYRVWIMAYAGRGSDDTEQPERFAECGGETLTEQISKGMDDAQGERLERGSGRGQSGTDKWLPWPPGPKERDKWAAVLDRHPELAPALSIAEEDELGIRYTFARRPPTEKTAEPSLRRVVDESARGVGKPRSTRKAELRALGNGVVPACVVAFLREVM